jgi:prephenate dehydrogenase
MGGTGGRGTDAPFGRIAVVGVGLIGGSVGLAARGRWTGVHVVGIDRREVAREALSLGAIDVVGDDLAAVGDADLVLAEIAPLLRPEAIVTDVGSTKRQIVEAAGSSVSFVGGHPLAGAATPGVAAARAQLFRGRPWILTPAPGVNAERHAGAVERLRRFIIGLGATPHVLEPDAHDRLMAFVSHLPQVVATSLLHTIGSAVGESGLALSGPGLADTTRLASSPGGLWAEILAANADHVSDALSALTDALDALGAHLQDDDAVRETFASAARWRRSLRLVGEAPRPGPASPPAPAWREVPAVRTYLEMTARPARLPFPPGIACRVERVDPCPPAFFRYLYREVGRAWHWTDRLVWNDDDIRAYLAQPGLELWVLQVDGAPAGYAELHRREGGEVELVYFGLMPDAIGRGLGGAFLSAAVDRAWDGETRRVWLHTCTLDHPHALSNYRKRGFRVVREEHYLARVPAPAGS